MYKPHSINHDFFSLGNQGAISHLINLNWSKNSLVVKPRTIVSVQFYCLENQELWNNLFIWLCILVAVLVWTILKRISNPTATATFTFKKYYIKIKVMTENEAVLFCIFSRILFRQNVLRSSDLQSSPTLELVEDDQSKSNLHKMYADF